VTDNDKKPLCIIIVYRTPSLILPFPSWTSSFSS
jgi:hypothetical protein